MKVKCIEKPEYYYSITLGKIYYVIEETQNLYKITNDKGEVDGFCKSRFEVVPESTLQETPVVYVEREKETITYKDFLASMPASARACVMIGTEGQTVSVYDMEFDCDTEERLQEVFSALIMLFKEDV